jgi:hypothetical protein
MDMDFFPFALVVFGFKRNVVGNVLAREPGNQTAEDGRLVMVFTFLARILVRVSLRRA